MKNKLVKSIFLAMLFMIVLSGACNAQTIPSINYGAAGTQEVNTMSQNIAGIAATIGIGVALVILIWLAIKYITAAPSDKADIKKSATAYVIGAVLLFAASGILGIIQTFSNEIFNGGGGSGGSTTPKADHNPSIEVVEK